MASPEVRRKRYGSETPRLFTPPLRELNEQTSLGFLAIEFAEKVCHLELFPWQRWLLIHALELAPALTVDTMGTRGLLDPLFRFRKVVVLVARQNGKSTLSQVLALFFMYVLSAALILGTAQDLDTAEEVWDGAQEIIDETPELAALADKPIRQNGKKAIRLKTGERYKVKAANRRAGRGLSGDLILLDELREHQTWDAWAAITKTTMARAWAMIWALSNAGDGTSVVLAYLRKIAHRALGDPDGINADDDPAALLPTQKAVESMVDLSDEPTQNLDATDLADDGSALALFEWSAPPGCPVTDRDAWAMANPSLGYGISEQTLAGDSIDDPEWTFRTECLCQWPSGALAGPFPAGAWEASLDPESDVPDGAPTPLGIDVSWNKSMAYVSWAGVRADGDIHGEVTEQRAGMDWIVPWLCRPETIATFGTNGRLRVVVQGRGAPVGPLLADIGALAHVDLVEVAGPDLGNGTGRLWNLVRAWVATDVTVPGGSITASADVAAAEAEAALVRGRRLHRPPQPVLDVAAKFAAVKLTGDGAMLWDRSKSPVDVAPLIALTLAVWDVTQPAPVPAPEPRIRVIGG